MSDTTYKWRMDDGGWGIPPQKPDFRAIPGDGKVTLKWSIPEATIINSQEVCRSKGIIIRRKTDDYPANENDGTLVVKQDQISGSFEDTDVTNKTTYYYRAFSYSDHNVLNRDPAAEKSATPDEAETCNITVITSDSLSTLAEDVKARLTLTNETTSATQTADISGAVGETIFSIPGGEAYHVSIKLIKVTESVEEEIDYYLGADDIHAIPNSVSDSYTAVNGNVRELTMTIQKGHVYGYDLDTNNSSPSDRVTYPETVNNKDFTPFTMNFSTGTPNYGGWSESQKDIFFMPKPCMLNKDGSVEYYLSISDYALQEDGATAADITDSKGTGKNAMMEWPKIWTKRVQGDDGIYHFLCSDIQISDEYDCLCNYDINDKQIDHFYTAIYFGSNTANVLRSKSGGSNMVSQTGTTEISYAKKNGDGWDIEVLCDRLLIADLLVLMGKSTDTQAVYGYGHANASSAYGQGTMNSKGLFYATSATADCYLKVFGMEFFWSNLWRRCEGLVTNASAQILYKLTAGTHDGSTAQGYNTTGDGYLMAGSASGSSGGYINKCKATKGGRIPTTASGSSSTYECDGLWYAASCFAFVGGYCYTALLGGAFCVYLGDAVSTSNSAYGAVLSCKPLAS